MDLGIVYGEGDGEQLFTAKKLTVSPGVKTTITDAGAYGLICVQGAGKINRGPLNSPNIIHFDELTEDEYFITEEGAKAGITYENTGATESLVILRYFGPEVNPDAPKMGAYKEEQARANLEINFRNGGSAEASMARREGSQSPGLGRRRNTARDPSPRQAARAPRPFGNFFRDLL